MVDAAAGGFAKGIAQGAQGINPATIASIHFNKQKVKLQKQKVDLDITKSIIELSREVDPAVRELKFNSFVTLAGGDPKAPQSKELLKFLSNASDETIASMNKAFIGTYRNTEAGFIQQITKGILAGKIPAAVGFKQMEEASKRGSQKKAAEGTDNLKPEVRLKAIAKKLTKMGRTEAAGKAREQAQKIEDHAATIAQKKQTLAEAKKQGVRNEAIENRARVTHQTDIAAKRYDLISKKAADLRATGVDAAKLESEKSLTEQRKANTKRIKLLSKEVGKLNPGQSLRMTLAYRMHGLDPNTPVDKLTPEQASKIKAEYDKTGFLDLLMKGVRANAAAGGNADAGGGDKGVADAFMEAIGLGGSK